MDNNNPQASQPVVTPTPSSTPNSGGGGSNTRLWIILGLAVVILILGGAYWYFSTGQRQSEKSLQPEITAQTKPSTTSVDILEKEANSIDIQPVDSEFTSVDADLKTL